MTHSFFHGAVRTWCHIFVRSFFFIGVSYLFLSVIFGPIDHICMLWSEWNFTLYLCPICCETLSIWLCFKCLFFYVLSCFKDFLCKFETNWNRIIFRNVFCEEFKVWVTELKEVASRIRVIRLKNCWIIESEIFTESNSRVFHCLICLRLFSITERKYSKNSLRNVFSIELLNTREDIIWARWKSNLCWICNHEDVV